MVTFVVLAGGLGKRFGGLKQVEEIGPAGESLFEYSIFDAIAGGAGEIIIICNPDVEKTLSNRFTELRTPLKFINQTKNKGERPPGTAHAIMLAMLASNSPVVCVNADDFYGREAIVGTISTLKSTKKSCLTAFPIEHTIFQDGSGSRAVLKTNPTKDLITAVEYVDCHFEGNDIVGTHQKSGDKQTLNNQLVSMNLWGFSLEFKEILLKAHEAHDPSAGEFQIPNVVSAAISDQSLEVMVNSTRNEWFGMTYAADIDLVKDKIREKVNSGEYPENLWRKV